MHTRSGFNFLSRVLQSLSSRPDGLIVGTSIWLATAGNLPLWLALWRLPDQEGWQGASFLLAFVVIVGALNAVLLSLLGWGKLLKPALTLFLLVAASGSYFMLTYGIYIDAGMMVNVVQTDVREARDLLNFRMPLLLAAVAGPPLWWIWRARFIPQPTLRRVRRQAGLALAGTLAFLGTVMLVYQPFASTMRNHTKLRYLINPLNSFYALGVTALSPLKIKPGSLIVVGDDARLKPFPAPTEPPLFILVLGETARSDSLSINGYERATMPLLSQRKDLFSARNAWSCGTSTAESLPCMFSPLGRDGFKARRAEYENLLDVLQRSGLAVLWLDNQSGCKGVCDRVPTQKLSPPPAAAACNAQGECFDEAMLQDLDARIAALDPKRRERGVVIVLHQMGSHGPAYFKRSAPERKQFQPECTSAALQACDRQQVVNAYDNSIVETDFFLARTIQWLQNDHRDRPSAMMYVSDHGESLGEGNLYLHGLPYALAPSYQKKIPWIFWMSPLMEQRASATSSCLQREHGDRRISHDSYFHTVLGAIGVQTRAYRPELDLLTACQKPVG